MQAPATDCMFVIHLFRTRFSMTAVQLFTHQIIKDAQDHTHTYLKRKGNAFIPRVAVNNVTLYRENAASGGHLGHVTLQLQNYDIICHRPAKSISKGFETNLARSHRNHFSPKRFTQDQQDLVDPSVS